MQLIFSNPLWIAIIILGIVSIVLLILVISMQMKLKKFLVGIESKTITDSLAFVSTNVKDLQAFKTELESYLSTVEKRLKKSIQSVNTIRFNPFKDSGGTGNQSFATAFLSEDGDGVIVSSLYSRDHISVFAKPIKKLASEYELSNEEKDALVGAKGQLK